MSLPGEKGPDFFPGSDSLSVAVASSAPGPTAKEPRLSEGASLTGVLTRAP